MFLFISRKFVFFIEWEYLNFVVRRLREGEKEDEVNG